MNVLKIDHVHRCILISLLITLLILKIFLANKTQLLIVITIAIENFKKKTATNIY